MALNAEPARPHHPEIRALRQELAQASNSQIMRIVATVDAMISRGTADQLVAPLRQRLIELRPPRPLRFARLLFHPLDPLIVPATRWRLGHHAIPRTAVAPMADHVRRAMGDAGATIEAAIAGHTDAETDLIAGLGPSLWPAAALILGDGAIPAVWDSTGLGDATFQPIAAVVSTLLGQGAAIDALCAGTANGLLPPRAEAIGQVLTEVAATNGKALPMLVMLMFARLPRAATLLMEFQAGPHGAAVQVATDQAADLLLRQLDEANGIEIQIAAGSLADCGGTVKGIATLLRSLETANAKSPRREKLRAVRDRLDAGCKARFASGLQDDLLIPLRDLSGSPDTAAISALEATARGLRVLETEGRTLGSGATYDLLLEKAAAALESGAMQLVLSPADQARLVEIIAGSEAALHVLGSRS